MKRTAIITGASNGIGKAITIAFSKEQLNVVLADVDQKNGKAVETKINENGGNSKFITCDVSDPLAIQNLVKNTIALFGRIDIIINNAGVSEFVSPFELTIEKWDHIINTNLRSCFLLTRDAAEFMKKNGGGAVVNIASTRAFMSEKNSEAYAASKGGIVALTHAMAISLADFRIKVNCISPGWIYDGSPESLRDIDHQQHPSGRVGNPDDIAKACLFLTDPKNSFMTGENLIIDGGMTKKMFYEH
jgi:NAD(P)-dependent dehydrogenase (short-subunit alcohol dehydrogenase family)